MLQSEDVDRIIPLRIRTKGFMVEYEGSAVVYDYIETDERSAHRARVRKTRRAFKDVIRALRNIDPTRDGLLFFSVFSHKTSRHLTPFYLVRIFGSSTFLAWKGGFYSWFFFLQGIFCLFAFVGRKLEKPKIKIKVFSLPYNFMLLNVSRLVGVLKAIAGSDVVSWEK